jgi:hypothetical protein
LKRLFSLAVLAVMLLTSCSGVSDKPGDVSAVDPTPTASAKDTPPVPLPEVIAAVAAAETLKQLPGNITPQELIQVQQADIKLWGLPGCNPASSDTSIDLSKCVVGDKNGTKTLVVLGDSNAFMWSQSLDFAGQRNGWKIVVVSKDNCGPATMLYYSYPLKRDFTECEDWQKWRQEQIAQIKPAAVLLVGWYGGNAGPDRPTDPIIWRDDLVKTVQQFPLGTKTAFLANSPHITLNPGDCLAKHSDDISQCAEQASDVVPAKGNEGIREAADQVGGTYIDDTPWFCAQSCPIVINNLVAYSGKYHINNDYGRYLSGVLADALRPALLP